MKNDIAQPVVIDFSLNDQELILESLELALSNNPNLSSVLIFCKEWYSNNQQFQFSTSGSTNKPKNIIVSRDQIIASVHTTGKFFNLKKGDVIFICLNTNYTGGKMMLARGMHLGLKAYIVQPSNFPFIKTEKHFFKLASFVPSQLFTLFNTQDSTHYLESFQNILIGGAPVHQDIKNVCKAVTSTNIYETFGMTETLSHIALKKVSGVYTNQPFEALPGIEIDSDENDCLRIRGDVTDNSWIETKDVVELIGDDRFYWRGRFDNIINSGGIKINPEEIETAIFPKLNSFKHSSFYISSEADIKLGQKLTLVIEGIETEKNLITILRDILPEHHSPGKIIYQSQFKRTLNGKIIRTL